jgi:hypothetical protein
MKKLLLIFSFLCSMCVSAYSQAVTYNAIATAYVTTTISQSVVFDSTMQQGGTFTMSALAHNGGGRAGQSDTANVKIEFYTAGNGLVASANSTYSANLPNPNAVCGNPCIDTAVPWTTLTISKTLTAAQAATVAYAKVYIYGIDGSYWAGDYGPWYRAPTLQLNGGGNLLYNPEFGPYNGITAQGWTSSPGFGACQGAWGGSNACIVNSDGVPGSSTAGLVANANGGGPSATGGTTSGQAGGYNSTMSVTNAGTGATAGTPPAPTVTSTTTTNVTSTVIIGNKQITVTTPTTVTNYSDGTSKTASGTPVQSTVSNSPFTGVHFGRAQVADAQWNVQACTQTNSCQIYSTAPGVTYNTGTPTNISSTQYITFIPNTGSDSATNPWTMILVNSDGTFTSLGTGHILVQGTDSSGQIYLFFSNDQWNGTLFSGTLGLQGQGMTFTGTQNPTVSQTETLAASMSPDPLVAGQSLAPVLCCGGSAAPFNADSANIAKVLTFVNRPTADSKVNITQIGNGNTITVDQSGTKNNYTSYNGNGSGNTINVTQSGNNQTVANYVDLTVTGNTNYVGITQNSTGGAKGVFANVQNDNNRLTVQQTDDGSHYAQVNLQGGNKTVDITQSGSASHMANISLSGQPVGLSLQQTGSTQQFYSIQFNCATAGGCAGIQVKQGN